MSVTAYEPQIGQLPFGNQNTNPEGSNYAVESQFTVDELNLIQKEIRREIFDAAPAQYATLKILMSKPFKEKNLDEFEYLENTFGRSPLAATAIVAAQAAVPGANQTQVIPVTAASIDNVTEDIVIIYPDGSHAVVVTVNAAGPDITVNSRTNAGLPAVADGDIISLQGTIRADGMTDFKNFERLNTITRFNFIQFFLRAQRWGRIELMKFQNAGTTDFLTRDKQEKLRQLRVDLFNTFWNGERGEYVITDGAVAKAAGGVFPLMIAAGAASSNPTVAGLQAAFEALAFDTNFKVEGGTRFIYGTDKILNEFSKIYKQPGLRYEPDNEIANLKLKRIEVGTMNFVLVPCELWREESCFPAEWQRRVIVLDQESITPVKMRGIPQMEMGETLMKGKNGTREDFQDFFVGAQMSIEFNNPLGGFILDIQ